MKKSRLTDFDSQPHRRHHRDQPARGRRADRRAAVSPDRTCCWSAARRSRSGSTPTDEALRPMGRATSGCHRHAVRQGRRTARHGRRPRQATSTSWSPPRAATPSGPRSTSTRVQGRGGLGSGRAGIREGGDLVGALTVVREDEVLVVMARWQDRPQPGQRGRTTGRDTSGVSSTPDAGRRDHRLAMNPERGSTRTSWTPGRGGGIRRR